MQNYQRLNDENKLIILLLIIVLFGLLIMTVTKKNSCGCKKSVVYRNNQLEPYVIRNERDIPMWAVNLRQRNREMFRNVNRR
jgi:hypothetical protein